MDQLDFPFFCDEDKLATFLTRYVAIEDEQDRLREEIRLLKEEFADEFPMRAALTALKVIRARLKLEGHKKEPMSAEHQSQLEGFVAAHLAQMEQDRTVPNMF